MDINSIINYLSGVIVCIILIIGSGILLIRRDKSLEPEDKREFLLDVIKHLVPFSIFSWPFIATCALIIAIVAVIISIIAVGKLVDRMLQKICVKYAKIIDRMLK